jgi:site-specific DNA-methyltransferase (adenine-specific)
VHKQEERSDDQLYAIVMTFYYGKAMIKPYYEENGITIYNGDCRDILPLMGDKSIDMILCDLPYGTTACKWDTVIPFEPLWAQYKRLIKDNGAIVLTASQPFTSALVSSNIENFKHYWIWDKELAGAFALAKYRPMIVTEEICVFSNGGRVNYYPIMEKAIAKNIRPINRGSSVSEATPVASGIAKSKDGYDNKTRFPKNIIKYSKYNAECNQRNRVHPTQKPVALFEYLIRTYTNEGDMVLDNCSGSGTTGIAALITKRNAILIDVSEKYCEIAAKRLAQGVLDFAS